MTPQDLQQIATVSDLSHLETRLLRKLGNLIDELRGLREDKKAQILGQPGRLFYSPKEFAELSGVSKATATNWCAEGVIKATQKGGAGTLWLIPVSEVQRLREEVEAIEPLKP